MSLDPLQYPIGRLVPGTRAATPQRRAECVRILAAVPGQLRSSLAGLSDAQVDTPYRPGGWTVRQVTHHLADSHMNALIRFKHALCSDGIRILPYPQDAWCAQADVRLPVSASLSILDGVHLRWSALLHGMTEVEFGMSYFHPDDGKAVRLDEAMEMYVWHSAHHLAHITGLREREGW